MAKIAAQAAREALAGAPAGSACRGGARPRAPVSPSGKDSARCG